MVFKPIATKLRECDAFLFVNSQSQVGQLSVGLHDAVENKDNAPDYVSSLIMPLCR